ncbi:MAG: hypothetical protein NW241_16950 [Bacteroidia bacterium]|nr:hypothetical protein [Bacteroidia bacterium]
MKQLLPFITLIAILLILNSTITQVLQYYIRRRLLDAGLSDEARQRAFDSLGAPQQPALQWALALFSGGLGLITLAYLPAASADSPLPYGIEAVFLSAGFLAYHFLNRRSAS